LTKYKIFGLDFNLSGKDNIKIEFILEKDYMLDKKVDSIILIYDITNRSTYEKCNYYLDKIKKLKEETKTILVGNKADQEEKRNVSIEEAANFAALNNIIFFEISCAKNKNITKVIKCAIEYNSLIFKERLNEHEQIYDVIIDINSILSLNDKGWEIKYPKGKENYEKKISKPSIIVGVLGNRKKGKSFILSKLTEYNIEHSFWLKTEGISVFYGGWSFNEKLVGI
jgi:ribosome biogenesis GTPase A